MIPAPRSDRDFPWWLLILAGIGGWIAWEVATSPVYRQVLGLLSAGIGVTVAVTAIAFAGACVLGLGLVLAGMSRFIVLRQAARLYIEVMRGIPILCCCSMWPLFWCPFWSGR